MKDWRSVELLGYVYYSDKGYRILVSLVENHDYDFVAEKDGEYLKVNVKKAGLKDKNVPNSWCIAKSGAQKGKSVSGLCDVYLAWLPHKECFIELDGDFFYGIASPSRIIPKKLYN